MMTDAKRKKLQQKIENASARQQARAKSQIAERAADAKNRVARAASEHPLLLIAGGLAVGVAISALIPKSPTRKLSKHAWGLASALAEIGVAYGKQAYGKLGEAAENTVAGDKLSWKTFRKQKTPEPTAPLEEIP